MEGHCMNPTMTFFNDLFGGYRELGYIELRSLTPRPDGSKESRAHFYDSIAQAASEAHDLFTKPYTNDDIYFGVLPRSQRDSHKLAVTQARVLWVDIDAKERTKEECLRALFSGNVPSPSYVVDSGNGVHGYWLIDGPHTHIDRIEDSCYGLARYVGGDACHNADRILRVPGTYNFKNPDKPLPVKIIRNTELRYELEDFTRFELVGQEYRLSTECLDDLEPVSVTLEELYEVLPDFIVQYVQEGLAADVNGTFHGDRSRLDFYVIGKLLRNGFTVHQVAGIFTDEQYAISAKTLSKRGRARQSYLANSIARAKGLITEERVGELV